MGMYVTYMQVALNRLSKLYLGTYIHIYMSQKKEEARNLKRQGEQEKICREERKGKNGVNAIYSLKYFLNILRIEVTHSPCLCAPYYLGGEKKTSP